MALINRLFNGKLNLDASPYKVPPTDYLDALNITRDAQGSGQDMVVSNILGNQKVLYSLPSGTNKEIGNESDALRNRIYYWVWNSNGYNLWLYYDKTNDVIVKLIEDLTDTGGIPVLAFNPSKRINHADIIYREEGDLVSWTDDNTTPKEANVDFILSGVYGVIQTSFIEAAKRPPLTPPITQYGTDATRNGNSLRRNLFQFSQAFGYDNFSMSTPSTFSKIALPVGFYGSDNDIDSSNNNFITVTVETGDKNVSTIEIYMRYNIADAWSNFVTIISLNKAQLNIPDNSTYQYLFYNDNIYPQPTQNFQYVDGVQAVPLFDWLPQKAVAQCQANGNTKEYAGITENYDNYPVNELQVTITAENKTNVPPDTDPPTLTYTLSVTQYTFTVGGSVPTGTEYRIVTIPNGVFADYISVGGDTVNDVALALHDYIATHFPGYASGLSGNTFMVIPTHTTPPFSIIRIDVTAGGSGSGTISTEKTWMDDCNYAFGLVYLDEQNRDMPGVTTFTNPVDSDNDFLVTTPSISIDAGNRQTPVISASINHLPPTGAKKYCWVRRRLQYSQPLEYETCDYQDDGTYLYFCLANIDLYKTNNSQFVYGTAPINPESRIKIKAGISTSSYTGDVYTQDYQILGVVTRTLTGGSSPDDDKSFIKVQKPSGSISPAYTANMLAMVYTPSKNPTSDADSVYWEWGETYGIYELNGVFYHEGQDQNQTASQPATFTWEEGDVYYHDRTMYSTIVSPFIAGTPDTVSIMDEGFSDFFNSSVNDNGRGQVIEANARHQFNPVLIRFSEAYQSGTNINGLNRFYPENFDEYDRSWGNINKLFIDRRYLYVFQEFNTGVVPIFMQVILDTSGNPLEANSEQLLNKITYPYDKQYGIGNVPESFAYGKGAMYGIDNNKAIVWRLTPQNGMEAISVLYECNAFFVAQLAAYKSDLNNGNPPSGGVYTGNATCYGVFDSYTNKYIIALEEINRYNSQGYLTFHQDANTLSFLETRDEDEGFESFYSYAPEGLCSLNNLLVTFKNGEVWKHDSSVYCNFYGVDYPVYIDAVGNDNILQKKSWQAITQLTDTIWSCPLMYTNVMSYGTQRQETALIEQNFKILEQYPSASIMRDKNSRGGIYNGDFMKGSIMVIRFQKTNARNLVILSGVSILYKDSALTSQ